MDRRFLTLLATLAVLTCGCQGDRSAASAAGEVETTTAAPTTAAAGGPTAQPTPAVGTGPVLDAAALPTGAPPKVAYAFARHPTFGGGHWELVRPDGSRHPFTENPALFAAYDDVVVNGYGTEGGFVVELFDGRARLQHEQRELCSYALVTTPDRGIAAWLQNDGSLVEQYADGSLSTRPIELPGGPCGGVDPVALNGPILYVDGPELVPMMISGPQQGVRIPQLSDLVDVSRRGNLIGRLRDEDRCFGLLRDDGHRRWRTCADRLVSFAPDGRHVLGTKGSVELAGFRGIVVHGPRNGRVEAEWANTRRQRVSQIEWEDAEHLLVVVRNSAVGWSVVRLGLDGSAEYAATPVRTGDGELAPFRLPMG